MKVNASQPGGFLMRLVFFFQIKLVNRKSFLQSSHVNLDGSRRIRGNLKQAEMSAQKTVSTI